MALAVGDKVVYPQHGAAVITGVESVHAFGEPVECFVIKIEHNDLVVRVPVDKVEQIGVREVVGTEEVDEILALLARKDVRVPSNWSRRFKNHTEKIKSGDIYQVAEVVRNLTLRDRENERGISPGEYRLLVAARQILLGELAMSLGTSIHEAAAVIDAAMA